MEQVQPLIISVVALLAAVYAFLKGRKETGPNEIERKAPELVGAPPAVARWKPQIMIAAEEARINPELLAAMVWTESSGDEFARGSAGEYGLMQIKPVAAEDVEKIAGKNIFGWKNKPLQNIRAGAHYFRLKLNENAGNIRAALGSYNQGTAGYRSGGIRKQRGDEYAQKVLNRLAKIRLQ
jgi:soluble lytic murein transglycosylase-like protein